MYYALWYYPDYRRVAFSTRLDSNPSTIKTLLRLLSKCAESTDSLLLPRVTRHWLQETFVMDEPLIASEHARLILHETTPQTNAPPATKERVFVVD